MLRLFPFSIRTLALVAASVAMLAIASAPLSASAHPIGGAWPKAPGHTLLKINYMRDCVYGVLGTGPAIWGHVSKAALSWTQTPTPLYFQEVPTAGGCNGKPNANTVTFYAYHDQDDSLLAYNVNYSWSSNSACSPFGCYTWTELMPGYKNKTNASVLWLNNSKFPMPGTIAHELGHSLGLNHAGYYAGEKTGGYSIMDYADYRPSEGPAPHDINDVNFLYPGW